MNAAEAIILIFSGARFVRKQQKIPVLVVTHFTHGNEEHLVKTITGPSEDSEIWIIWDDDAIGIGALGIPACQCVIAESCGFFEDHGLDTKGQR